jgi:drug/metabolite transporter (DMT)-like permease
MSRRAWILMALLAATWGASYLFIKVGLRDFTGAQVVCIRTALAAMILIPVAIRLDAFSQLRGLGPNLVLMSVVQVVIPFLLISYAEHYIASSLAGILVASAPIYTALLAIRFDDAERSTGWGLVGVIAGIVGVALLFGVDLSGSWKALIAGVGILFAGLCYAAGAMLLKHRLPGAPAAGVAACTMSIAALITLPVALIHLPSSAGADSISALLALGALGTGVAFLIFYTLISEEGPARASLVAYIAPGFAVIYGVTLLDESITAGTIAGLALILAGSWMGVEGRPPWRGKEPAPVPASS